MDIEHLTNFRDLVGGIEPRLIPPFILGIIFGGLVMTAVWRKFWWLLVILLLWPVTLYIAGLLLPLDVNLTYRLFFLGIVTIANMGLAWYLSSR